MPAQMYVSTPSFQTPVLALLYSQPVSNVILDQMEIEMSWQNLPNLVPEDSEDLYFFWILEKDDEYESRDIYLQNWMNEIEDELDLIQQCAFEENQSFSRRTRTEATFARGRASGRTFFPVYY